MTIDPLIVKATQLPLPEPQLGEVVTVGANYGPGHDFTSRVRTLTLDGEWRALYLGKVRVYRACGRCAAEGALPEYGHVYDGVCFECGGRGIHAYADTLEKAQRKARSGRAAEMRAAAKQAIADAEWAAGEAARVEAAHAEALTMHAVWEAKQAEQAAKLAAQRYAGEPGDKLPPVTGVVARALTIEQQFGYRTTHSRLVIIEGTGPDEGITLKTFGTSNWHWDTEEGQTVTVTGSVKAHEEYAGTKQTVIIRPKGAST